MPLSQKYEDTVRKFSFLARCHFNAESYCCIYIVIFGKHLSELYWIVLMLYNWLTLLPLLSLHTNMAGRNYENCL